MICGHCKERDQTLEHIRKCSGAKFEDDNHLSEDQQTYLRDLLKLFNLVLPGELTPETIGRREGKAILDGLIGARRLQAMGQDYELPDGVLVSPKPRAKRSGERRPGTRRGR